MEKKKKEVVVSDEPTFNIRCRKCMMVDGYKKSDTKCKHCEAKLYFLDTV